MAEIKRRVHNFFTDRNSFDYVARMVFTQSHSLEMKLKKSNLQDYYATNKKLNKLRKVNYDFEETQKWLVNAWNTERILRLNSLLFEEEGSGFALQWSFPQAYYSVYCSTSSMFYSTGKSSRSHSSVIKEANKLIEQKYYPSDMSFLATGGKNEISYLNILKPTNTSKSTTTYDHNDESSINNQICQVLKTTRVKKLDSKREDFLQQKDHRVMNNQGLPLKKLNKSRWNEISNSIGTTSIFDLLYRKRIKSNYRDVEIFQSAQLRSSDINNSLIHVVSYINHVHEIMLTKALGKKGFNKHYDSFLKKQDVDFLVERKEFFSK